MATKQLTPKTASGTPATSASATAASGADASVQKPKRKVGRPGRKKIDTEAKNRRTAQNRAAQRAFRERKEQKLKSLENKISNLEQINEQSEFESSLLRDHLSDLINEISKFRGTSARDMEVLDLLARSGTVKRDLRLQNLHEDENIADVDNVKNANGNYNNAGDAGLSTAAAEAAAVAAAAAAERVVQSVPVAPEVHPIPNVDIAQQLLGKPELSFAPQVSHSPRSISSSNADSPFSTTNSVPHPLEYQANNMDQLPLSASASASASSSSSNIDIIDNLFNAAYAFDNHSETHETNVDNHSSLPSSSNASATEFNSEYNLTNQFPSFNTNMFSMYGGNSNGAASSTTNTMAMPQFTLNNLTNTWNNGNANMGAFRSPGLSGRIPSTSSSEFVPEQPVQQSMAPLSTKPSIDDEQGTQFMSFLSGSLAFPDMDDTVLFKQEAEGTDLQVADTSNCACGHGNDKSGKCGDSGGGSNGTACKSRSNSVCGGNSGACRSRSNSTCGGRPIKCELLTRHIINDESIRSILKDKNFMKEGPGSASSTAAACAAGCDGVGCNKVALPYGPDGRVLQCADVWRHITTLPKYSDVDIDNLCDELMTKINYSDEGITIRPRDFESVLRKQTAA